MRHTIVTVTRGCQLYRVPDFNLTCKIFTVGASSNSLRMEVECALVMGPARRRDGSNWNQADTSGAGFLPTLCLPAGTDVRDSSCGGKMDLVEVPSDSGRFYLATMVDDVAKGWPNEYRLVSIQKTWGFAGNGSNLTDPWPTPIP